MSGDATSRTQLDRPAADCAVPNDLRLICPLCTSRMVQVHGHLQCPACRYVEPCCW